MGHLEQNCVSHMGSGSAGHVTTAQGTSGKAPETALEPTGQGSGNAALTSMLDGEICCCGSSQSPVPQ